MKTLLRTYTIILFVLSAGSAVYAAARLDPLPVPHEVFVQTSPSVQSDLIKPLPLSEKEIKAEYRRLGLTLYQLPFSRTTTLQNWKQLWINTGVLVSGGIATLIILEALPEDATAWNRAEIESTPLFKRWINHVKEGPVWDHDKFIFNYVLHPYGGAAYYMSARSCGFNCWGSFLYSFCISTFFWEYGFEAFNEVPSVQDLVITPVVGSLFGEGFYLLKRHIVSNGYSLLGSSFLGHFVAFLCDPVNELVGYFTGAQKRAKRFSRLKHSVSASGGFSLSPTAGGMAPMFSVSITL